MEEQDDSAEFLGTHHHAMDTKGRLVLPATFRELLKEGMVMTIGYDNCLTLQTTSEWKKTLTTLRSLKTSNPRERLFTRLVASNAEPQTLDKQGRISIPQDLREYARLDKDVAVVGAVMLAKKSRRDAELPIEGLYEPGSVGPDGPRRSTNASHSSGSEGDSEEETAQ